jgi:hypothetical protein
MFHVFRVITKKLPFHFEHFYSNILRQTLEMAWRIEEKTQLLFPLKSGQVKSGFFSLVSSQPVGYPRKRNKTQIRFVPVLSKIRVKSNDQK